MIILIAGSQAGFGLPAYAGSEKIEIITNKEEYYPGETVAFTVRGRIMFAKEADGKIIYPPYSIWDENMKKINLKHSCLQGVRSAYDQYCQAGVLKEVEVARCPEASFSDYGDIDEKFTWDQKIYVEMVEPCGKYAAHREVKNQVSPGKYRIVVCGNIQSCVEKEIVIKGEPEVSIDIDKTEYRQGEGVKITIQNNLDRSLVNYDWNLPAERDYYNKDAGWGYVEKFKSGSWLRVEPLWRCGGECFTRCKLGPEFFTLMPKGEQKFPGDFRYFTWDQTKVSCLPEMKHKQVSPGRYRISCTFLDSEKDEVKSFHSGEFEIKQPETP